MSSHFVEIEGVVSTARFINRPNRFLVQIIPNGLNTIEEAFLHDPGRMKELLVPNASLIIRKPIRDIERKTSWDILGVQLNDKIVVINSSIPNIIARKALMNNWIEELADFQFVKQEISVNDSRLDFLLKKEGKKCYIEVKGVTLVSNRRALFPDAPTSRGVKHLQELISLRKKTDRAVILFLCMRSDPTIFSPNWSTDPLFSTQLKLASEMGVEILVFKILPVVEDDRLLLYFQNKIKVEIVVPTT